MAQVPHLPAFADLHLLTVLAQTRSYTQAARRLGISKASVSMRIGELERTAGVPLVRRTTRSVGLTAAGQQLVDDTQDAFTRIEQSFAGVRDLAGAPRGLVRVTAPVALGRQHIAPGLPAFLQAHPEIRLELDLSDRFVNLAQEGFDLAIRHAQAPPDTHVAWVLCESRALLVASPAYLRRHGTPSHPSELAEHQCLLYLRDGASQGWAFEREGGRKSERVLVAVRGPLKANNSEVLREALLGGLGIGLLPDFSAAGWLEPRKLVPLLPRWRPQGFFGDKLYAIRPWSSQVPRAVQCFVDHLRQSLAAGFPLPQ
ncbi:MAG TPA: LysR family transcriptional regulator [Ramlibacter sp.]|nr:LysR family transcriptional regulator [Ramlibacter sp.]